MMKDNMVSLEVYHLNSIRLMWGFYRIEYETMGMHVLRNLLSKLDSK